MESENWKETMLRLPKGMLHLMDSDEPNQPFCIFRGEFSIEKEEKREQIDGRLDFQWLPKPDFRFTGSVKNTVDFLNHFSTGDEVTLRIPSLSFKAIIILTKIVHDSEGLTISGFLNEHTYAGEIIDVDYIDFELTNFHKLFGEAVRYGGDDHLSIDRARLSLTSDTWDLTMDKVAGYRKRIERVKDQGGYIISSACRLNKTDETKISPNEADMILQGARIFLSFLRGIWCSLIFAQGKKEQNTVWQCFWPWRVSPWKDVPSWFPRLYTTQIKDAWAGFAGKWLDPDWQYPLSMAIHWYVEANMNAGAIEGSIIFTQTALELLSWVMLVEETQSYTTREFKRFGAKIKIRKLLGHCGIPCEIPSPFSTLQTYTDNNSCADGPEAYTRFRNNIIHPRKHKRESLKRSSVDVRYEVLQLGLWYIELVLLNLFSYNGVYYDRCIITGTHNEFRQPVPWSE